MAPKIRLSFTELEARRQNLKNHIRLLEARYPEPVRREAVEVLERRLRKYQVGGGDG